MSADFLCVQTKGAEDDGLADRLREKARAEEKRRKEEYQAREEEYSAAMREIRQRNTGAF